MLFGLLQGFLRDRRGNVSIIGGLALPLLVGFGALVGEVGHGLVMKMETQRVADSAAFAAGLAYAKTSSTDTMSSAALSVAALNGIASSKVTTTLGASPRTATNQAVLVKIQQSKIMMLAPVIGAGRSLNVRANSSAEVAQTASPCILALDANASGVTLSGGTTVSATSCTVASNNVVTVPCGTTIKAKTVAYNSTTAPSQPCTGITADSIVKTSTADPLANDSGVTTAVGRLTTVSAMAAPTMSSVTTGVDIDFAYSTSTTQTSATNAGCTASISGNTWTMTCPSGRTYNFGNITLGGGITVNFNTGGTAATVYNFSGNINNSGTALTFGPGTFNIAKGLKTGGGSTTTFGAGTFKIGPNTTTCNNSYYSICNTSTLTFGGPSTFVLTSGVFNSGGSTLTFGSGSSNSFQVGPAADGNAFVMGGGAKTTFADATGSSSVFELTGNLNVSSGGGSCLTISAATQHDIKGYLSTAGGTSLGAGTYTIRDYVALGANGGGDVTCNGATVGMSGSNVTLVIGAKATISGSGTCSQTGFCLAAGYSNVTLTAPTTGTLSNLVVVGPTSSSTTAGATFAEGSSNTSLSGALYFPYGPITLTGGAKVGDQAGQCLQMIGSQVSLGGGTATASSCRGTSAGAAVVLVQ